MIRYIKQAIKGFLRRHNRILVYASRDTTVSGLDFREDLKVTIGKKSPVCLDVGANQGQTIELLQEIFSKPAIYAFEPSTKMFQILLKKNFRSQVFLHNFAFGKEVHMQEFTNYKDSNLNSFLQLDTHEENRYRNIEIETKELVQIDTVDRFLQQHGINDVDLLKIDTQGFDLEVLLGAVDALQSGVIRNVLVELNFRRKYKGQSSATDIMNLLAKYDILLVDFYEKILQKNTLAWCTALFCRR